MTPHPRFPFTYGMVLAAGLGTRLRPLTANIPKPLVPVLNLPNLCHIFHFLKRWGVPRVVLNSHYLAPQIDRFVQQQAALPAHVLFEPLILGIGGGIGNAKSVLQHPGTFLCTNSDWVGDIDIAPAWEIHHRKKAWATLILLSDPHLVRRYSRVGITPENFLCELPGKKTDSSFRTGMYSGIMLLDPKVFDFLSAKPSGVLESLFFPLMENHPARILGVFCEGYWGDTGDFEGYWKTTRELLGFLEQGCPWLEEALQAEGYHSQGKGIWVHASCATQEASRLQGPLVLGKDCQIGRGAEVGPYLVLGDAVAVPEGVSVSHAVLFPKTGIENDLRGEILSPEGRLYAFTT